MKRIVYNARSLGALFMMVFFSGAFLAQGPVQIQRPAPEITESPRPNPKGSDPKPQEAVTAVLAAFDKYEVVGMSAAHGVKDLDDFILGLIRNPAFPNKVNDVVVECGNSLYQPILDRYIAGGDMPPEDARQVWRDTAQTMCNVSAFYEQLFPLIRRINQKLPPQKRLRVLAGDPPIDWSKVKSREDISPFQGKRDFSIASVMEKEVLSKHRKALMLFGTPHMYHDTDKSVGPKSAVAIYEKDYPHLTLVIAHHMGFGNSSSLAKYNDEFEGRLASWPIPSLVSDMTGTWLADLLEQTQTQTITAVFRGNNGPQSDIRINPGDPIVGYSKLVDAYLYLGPRDLLLKETKPAEVFLNKNYMAEVQRRAAIMNAPGLTDQSDPEKVSDRGNYTFLLDPKATKAGPFTQSTPTIRPLTEHKSIKVDPKILDAYLGEYQLTPTTVLTFTREGDRFLVNQPTGPQMEVFAESETEFFLKAIPAQITFVKNAQGQVTHLVMHQPGRDREMKKVT